MVFKFTRFYGVIFLRKKSDLTVKHGQQGEFQIKSSSPAITGGKKNLKRNNEKGEGGGQNFGGKTEKISETPELDAIFQTAHMKLI